MQCGDQYSVLFQYYLLSSNTRPQNRSSKTIDPRQFVPDSTINSTFAESFDSAQLVSTVIDSIDLAVAAVIHWPRPTLPPPHVFARRVLIPNLMHLSILLPNMHQLHKIGENPSINYFSRYCVNKFSCKLDVT